MSGLQIRDFIFVSDVVDAYIRAAGLDGSGPVRHGVYNIGTGRSTSILELAKTVQNVLGSSAAIEFLPERAGDIRYSLEAVDKFREAAGWTARVVLKDGLQATAEFRPPGNSR